MFAIAQNEVRKKVQVVPITDLANIKFTPELLPINYSLAALYDEILSQKESQTLQRGKVLFKNNQSQKIHQDTLEISLLLNTCLHQIDRLSRESSDQENIHRLMVKISKMILPHGNLFLSDPSVDDVTMNALNNLFLAEKKKSLNQTRLIAELGLSCIVILRSFLPEDEEILLENQVLTSLLAFTSESDPWTTASCLDFANRLISLHRAQLFRQDFITETILSSLIRPLFVASRPKAITSSGYAAISSCTPREPYDFNAWNVKSKPWRLDTCYAVTVLSWAVRHIPQEAVTTAFHLIIPPLLILLDSPNTSIQLKGLQMLDDFVRKLTPKLLEQTGLGGVIEDAIHPILLYLPPITPLIESATLLPAAYKALFTLIEVRFPFPTRSGLGDQDKDGQKQKLNCLTRLLRQSLIPAYTHTSHSSKSDPVIQKIILDQIPPLVSALGINCIAHLYALMPLVEDVLLDPFASAYPSLVFTALKALEGIIIHAWPRLGNERRRMEVIRMLVSGWEKLREETGDSFEHPKKEVLEEFKIVGKLFVKAVTKAGEAKGLSSHLEPLFEADNSLREVFSMSDG
ncbi:hypothetical protein Golomagni_01321 [Golovinomyces magnicellulatus]|nr:hypothetical protein Golomagni_01321 [Golovinomyces magnicellulatus]